MGLLTEAANERTIDRELDQTALHNHMKDGACPTCSAVEEYHEPATVVDLREQIRLRDERIQAFEQFTANLATHIDGMQQAVDQLIPTRKAA